MPRFVFFIVDNRSAGMPSRPGLPGACAGLDCVRLRGSNPAMKTK
jgi:hypothetical protein